MGKSWILLNLKTNKSWNYDLWEKSSLESVRKKGMLMQFNSIGSQTSIRFVFKVDEMIDKLWKPTLNNVSHAMQLIKELSSFHDLCLLLRVWTKWSWSNEKETPNNVSVDKGNFLISIGCMTQKTTTKRAFSVACGSFKRDFWY